MKLAIDVDGVLADHVPAVLSKIRSENSEFTLTKEDIKTWDEELPNISSDMKTEIEKAESNPNFVKSMPPVKGAVRAMNHLASEGHDIIIVTNRPASLLPATHEWLEFHGIPHLREESLSTKGLSKSISDADVLIDDYPINLREFMNGGIAILFVQPWNSKYCDEFSSEDRAYAASTWDEIVEIINKL